MLTQCMCTRLLQVMQELSSYKKVIVSTGGGVVTRRSNWMYMQQGLVVYLDFPISVLAERLMKDKKAVENRPKLKAAAKDQACVPNFEQYTFNTYRTLAAPCLERILAVR